MGILELLNHRDLIKLDVEILIDALQNAADLDVILEFDRDLVVDECFEETNVGLAGASPFHWGCDGGR